MILSNKFPFYTVCPFMEMEKLFLMILPATFLKENILFFCFFAVQEIVCGLPPEKANFISRLMDNRTIGFSPAQSILPKNKHKTFSPSQYTHNFLPPLQL